MKKLVSVIVTIILIAFASVTICAYTTAQNNKNIVRAGALMNRTESLEDKEEVERHVEASKKPNENAWRTGNGYIDSQGRFIGTWDEIRVYYIVNPGVEVHWVCTDYQCEGITTYYGSIWSGVSETHYIVYPQ